MESNQILQIFALFVGCVGLTILLTYAFWPQEGSSTKAKSEAVEGDATKGKKKKKKKKKKDGEEKEGEEEEAAPAAKTAEPSSGKSKRKKKKGKKAAEAEPEPDPEPTVEASKPEEDAATVEEEEAPPVEEDVESTPTAEIEAKPTPSPTIPKVDDECESPAIVQDANSALRQAIDTNDLQAIVDAITMHGEFGPPELVTEARAARDKIRKNKRKAAKQGKALAEVLARAESAFIAKSAQQPSPPPPPVPAVEEPEATEEEEWIDEKYEEDEYTEEEEEDEEEPTVVQSPDTVTYEQRMAEMHALLAAQGGGARTDPIYDDWTHVSLPDAGENAPGWS